MSLAGYNLVVFYYLIASEILPDMNDGLWWDGSDNKGSIVMIIYMDMYDNLYIDMTDFVSNIIVVLSYFSNCITSLSLNFDYSTDIYNYRVLDMVESLVKIQPPADLVLVSWMI